MNSKLDNTKLSVKALLAQCPVAFTTYCIAGNFWGVQIFVKSCRGSSELIFVVLNFVTPEARYAITD